MTISRRVRKLALLAVGLLLGSLAVHPLGEVSVQADDWPRFRGPGGQAMAADDQVPTEFSLTKNLAWRTKLPGPGGSSPVIWGDRVFLTAYSGYGLSQEEPGDEAALVQHVLCFQRSDGKLLWRQDIQAKQPIASYADFLVLHGYTTNTPYCDGSRLYVSLGKTGLFCFDLEGNQLWTADLGRGFHNWGSAGSPVLHQGRLFANATIESQSLFAFDPKTGEVQWRVRPVISSWSTPVIAKLDDGAEELIFSVKGKLLGLDPANGETLWTAKNEQSYAAPSPVTEGDVVYSVYGGRPSVLMAVRAGGRGDVSESRLLWKAQGVGSGITSPVLVGDFLYAVSERGVLGSVSAKTGEVLSRERLASSGSPQIYASPVAVGDRLFIVTREDGVFVTTTGAHPKVLAHNQLEDASIFNATPAVSNGQMFLRSDQYLYCVSKTSTE